MKGNSPQKRRLARQALAALSCLILAGCAEKADRHVFDLVIGGPGHTSGFFNKPRGITWDRAGNVIFVVDWDGRIQKFDCGGGFRGSWIMPDVEKGKPEDLCMTPDGNLLVADTHYSRVVEYTTSGVLVGMFGRYGRGQGEFIYPVGIACDTNGNIYVSEYGENDRIQKFGRKGEFIKAWGRFGDAPGEFRRPSGIEFGDNGELYVADAVNHRIQVFDTQGQLLRIIGSEGTEAGRFRYPYDVCIGGTNMYVLEYGNQRIQKMTLDGRPLWIEGQPGNGDGFFAAPWRCATVSNRLYVSDTGNSRVVRLSETR